MLAGMKLYASAGVADATARLLQMAIIRTGFPGVGYTSARQRLLDAGSVPSAIIYGFH